MYRLPSSDMSYRMILLLLLPLLQQRNVVNQWYKKVFVIFLPQCMFCVGYTSFIGLVSGMLHTLYLCGCYCFLQVLINN